MSSVNHISSKKLVILLAPMVMALPLAMDVYIPAVPNMSTIFQVAPGTMQLTLTLFMLMAGLMQLVIGPISDSHGRKLSSLVMMGIFALGCFFCANASDIHRLIIYRGIQAIGSCGMMVIAMAIVRDIYHGTQSAKVYSLLNGIISFSPMFAPFIGSYVDIHFGWQATFYILLLIPLWASVNFTVSLPESLAPQYRQPLRWRILLEYRDIFCHKTFLPYTITTAMGLSYLYIFCSISPYIIIRTLHLPESHYGFYFSFMGISLLGGSFFGGILVERIGIYSSVISGLLLSLIGGLLMLIWYWITGLTIHNFIWPMLLIGLGGTICMGAGNGGAMEPFSHNIGAAAALGGSLRFIFAGIVGAIVVHNKVASTLPLALPAILFSLIALLMFRVMRSTLRDDNDHNSLSDVSVSSFS